MELSNEYLDNARKNINRDARMLECIDNMHSKMEYEVSREDPNVSYISIDGVRLIFENGEYKGWLILEKEGKENEPTVESLNKITKRVRYFFSKFLPPVDVYICECSSDTNQYTKIGIIRKECKNFNGCTTLRGSINYLASLSQEEFCDILTYATWDLLTIRNFYTSYNGDYILGGKNS